MTTEIAKTIELTKEYIDENLFNKLGRLDSNKTKKLSYSTEEIYLVYNGLNEIPKCPVCGKNKKFVTFKRGYKVTCGSFNCSNNNIESNRKRSESILKSTDIALEKRKKTKFKKYGNEDFTNRRKCKETVKQKYGVENVFQLEEVKLKIKKTCLENHGDENYRNPKKARETLIENHGITSPFCIKEVHQKATKTKWENHYKNFNRSDFELYSSLVKKYTEANDLKVLENYDKRGNHAYDDSAYHLDHKFSIKEGFRQGILPHIIGNINNLEMLPWLENVKKYDKCSITIEELSKSII
jgi:hypothetical protein